MYWITKCKKSALPVKETDETKFNIIFSGDPKQLCHFVEMTNLLSHRYSNSANINLFTTVSQKFHLSIHFFLNYISLIYIFVFSMLTKSLRSYFNQLVHEFNEFDSYSLKNSLPTSKKTRGNKMKQKTDTSFLMQKTEYE